ncbi:HEAT repeat-containing protein 4 [Narcine bancroftii]|uniref:HEAT repeat-containing protein 4 n=1 Tax=Narcine bancroftii TaxID=1343680 RepID=UPI00383101C8
MEVPIAQNRKRLQRIVNSPSAIMADSGDEGVGQVLGAVCKPSSVPLHAPDPRSCGLQQSIPAVERHRGSSLKGRGQPQTQLELRPAKSSKAGERGRSGLPGGAGFLAVASRLPGETRPVGGFRRRARSGGERGCRTEVYTMMSSYQNSRCSTTDEAATSLLKLPAVEATDPSQNRQIILPPIDVALPRRNHRQLLHDKYVRSVAQNLSFSKDVVNSMAFYGIPLKTRGDSNNFDLFKVITPPEPNHLMPVERRSHRCKLARRKSKQDAVSPLKGRITRDSAENGNLLDQHKGVLNYVCPSGNELESCHLSTAWAKVNKGKWSTHEGSRESSWFPTAPPMIGVPGFELKEDIVKEPGALNWSAANLKVKRMELPPKPKTMLNSKIGKHVYYTENVFEQELYTGLSRVVHHHGEKYKERIIMNNLSEYQKHLQELFPPHPAEWSKGKEDQDQQQTRLGTEKVSRGLRRWTSLPTLADYTTEKGLRRPDYVLTDKPVEKSSTTHKDLQVLRNMVTEWIKARCIYSHWQDVTVEELERDLRAMHSHIQLNALATCASWALECPKLEEDQDAIHIYSRSNNEVKVVPEALQPLINEALSNDNRRVRLAAAICHVTMEQVNGKVREILQDALLHGDVADRWIAAQSLALTGDDSYPVVNRIIQHLFEMPDAQAMKQVCDILGPLSEKTSLVHFILATQLKNHDWKDKVLACKVLSCLRGSLNMDLMHKIVYLMWNDWNNKVRQAATQALGALGLGKKVHDELRERLEKGDSRTRIEALSCIGQLGVMTGKLMPSFLDCFKDDFTGVRREACLTAGLLKLKDEKVLDHLLRLMQSDHIWKVKAYAIKALGAIGYVTEELKDLLLWALHYENEPGIRMEICNTIVSLNLQDPKVQAVLRERLLVESDPLVWKDVRLALLSLGGRSEMEEGMVKKIKDQVCTLCQKDVVTSKLLRLEKVKLNVSQQLEWINLKTQPEQLKVLKKQIEHLHQTVTDVTDRQHQTVTDPSPSPMQARVKDFECEVEAQLWCSRITDRNRGEICQVSENLQQS